MKKMLKKSIALLLSAGICASMTAVPASAADVKFTLNENAKDATEAAVIKATYKEGGVLDSVSIEPVSINADADTYTHSVEDTEGDVRYFLWDSANGMKPLAAEGVVSEATEQPTETDAPAPTDTTAPTATAEPTTEYTVKIGTVTGGDHDDVKIVKTAAAKPVVTPAPTQAPTPEPTPVVTPDPSSVLTFTFGDATSGAISSEVDFGNGLKFIPSSDDKCAYDKGANATEFGDNESGLTFPNRIKLGGKSTFTTARVFEFTPAAAGTITVYFAHGSSSGDPRSCVIQQNGAEKAKVPANASEKTIATAAVDAGAPVYIGGDNNIGFYGIVFIPNAAASIRANLANAFAPLSVDPADDVEELVTELKVNAGETVTLKARSAGALENLAISTDPDAEIAGPVDKANGAEYYTFTMPEANITVNAEYSEIPAPEGDIIVDASQDTNADAKTFKTVNEAIAYAKTMNSHASEADRIVIDVVPGTYREQIMIDVNYLTIRKAAGTTGDVLFTWYYGIGYQYYSTGSDGFYSKEAYEANKAAGTVATRGVDRWGCATRLSASNFIAQDITFENSFNRYMTQEELDDGVYAAPLDGAYSDTGNKPARPSLDTPVYNRTYTERAAAIAIEDTTDKTEFYNCKFLSSQDTVYSGSKANRIYFKDCVIEGQTDYIFGGNTLVFDNCDFSWAGYGNEKSGGHVTAVKNSSTDKGYLLYGGRVVTGGLEGGQFTQGDFGRPWGGSDSPTAAIGVQVMNLPDGTAAINANGWGNWSTPAKESKYYEYGTLDANGKAIDLTNRNALTPDVWEALVFNPYSYLVREGDDWDPMGVKSVWEPVIADMDKLTIPESDTLKLGENGVYEVSGSFTLPTAIEGYEAYDIHFVSNNENYAKIDPSTGVVTVTRPVSGNIDTTITAYIKLKDSTMAGPVGASKEIKISITPDPAVDPAAFEQAMAAAKAALAETYSEKNSYGMTILDRQAPIPVIDEIDGVITKITAEYSGFINEDGTIVRNAYASEESLGSVTYTIECIKNSALVREVITYDVVIPTDKADILYEDFEGGYSTIGGSVIDDASGKSGKAAKGALTSSFDIMPCADDTVVVSYRVLGKEGTVTLKNQAGADYLVVSPDGLTDDWNTVVITIDQANGKASVVVNDGDAAEVEASTTISDDNKIASIAFANGTYDDVAVLAHPDVTKVYSTFWRANENEVGTPADTYLMRGMTIMYSPDKKGAGGTVDDLTFSCGLSSNGVNGSWSNGVASNNSLKFVAPADGVWTVYAIPGSGKAFHVGNASDDQTMNGENKATSLSVNVKKGETYYATVAGSKGNYLGAKFVPAEEGSDAPDTYITTVFDFQKPAAGEYELQRGETREFYATNSKGGTETLTVSLPTDGDPKFYNTNWNDWVSVNPVVTIKIPVVNGSTITVGETYKNDEAYTINGQEFTGGNNSYTYYGTEKTVDMIITTGGYFRTITVTSPEHPSEVVPTPDPEETPDPGETEEPKELDIAINLTKQSENHSFLTEDEVTNKSAASFGVTADLARTDVNDNLETPAEGAAVVNLKNIKYHSDDHGVNPGTAEVYVTGYTKITIGTCAWGSTATLKANGSEVASVNTNTGACYHNNTTANVVVMYYNSDEPALLEISGGNYWPYIAFESVSAEEIPHTVDVTYSLGDETAVGAVPASVTVDVNSEIKISKYGLLYKDGYTLTAWTPDNGTTEYKVGGAFTADKDMTLTPVFTKNADGARPVGEVVFDFQKKNGAPVIGWENKTGNVFVAQGTTADGKPIDVKIVVDTTPGKLNNGGWDDWAQCNPGTVFTVPVVKDAVVKVGTIMNGSVEGAYSINGVPKTGSDQSEIIAEDIDTAKIEIVNVGYIRTISVTYPETVTEPEDPTEQPTEQPTEEPTEQPTEDPTEEPSEPAEPIYVVSGSDAIAVDTELVNNGDVTIVTAAGNSNMGGVKFNDFGVTSENSMQIRTKNDLSATNPYGDDNGGSATLVVKPAKKGTLTLYYRRQAVEVKDGDVVTAYTYDAADGKDVKVSAAGDKTPIKNGEFILGTKTEDEKYATAKQTYKLEADKEYVVWARGTTLQLCAIDYTADEVTEPEEPEEPEEPTEAKELTFIFEGADSITENIDFGNGLKFIGPSSSAYDKGGKATEFGDDESGLTFPNRIKLGGKSTFNTARVFEFIPAAAGTVKVYFSNGGGAGKDSNRNCVIKQNGKDDTSALTTLGGEKAIATAEVAAATPVYIGGDDNIGIYCIIFTPAK